ncbi:hypothetical protein [uncultured Psychroserpens sp.]|uniref:hypothetical protein n=1 Tax=uncultured Psychroserpens sp. TaxID=255436 RepID=UPI00262DCEB4|nr:hypothetical protein [uncultured Psychroserpens sp.]
MKDKSKDMTDGQAKDLILKSIIRKENNLTTLYGFHSELFPEKSKSYVKSLIIEIEKSGFELANFHHSSAGNILVTRIGIIEPFLEKGGFEKIEKKEKRKEQKEKFDFNISKWKYHTFWWFFALAIFGGGYSAYDFINGLNNNDKTEVNVNENVPNTEQSTNSQNEKKWTDSNGNVFIEEGNEISIIPANYNKNGKTYKVFIYNETSDEIGIIENLKIRPSEFKIFNLKDTDTLELDNGVKFMFGETYGLEVADKKSQVNGLGGKFLDEYKVPDEVEWAFVIVPAGKGD